MMKRMILSVSALLLAGAAQAQLLNGGAHVGAGVSVPNPLPQTTQAVGRAGADVARTAGDTVRSTADTAKTTTTDTARTADRVASASKPVRVDAGASIRVERGTRCYYDDYTYDPIYRDGYYYCERSGSGAAARVSTDPHK